MQESNENITKLFDYISSKCYNKYNLTQALANKPVMMVLVAYALNEKNELISRRVHSSVICISGHKQSRLDQEKADNEWNIPNGNYSLVDIDLSMFLTEDEALEEMKRKYEIKHRHEWQDSWQIALSDIIRWDNNYRRPRGGSCMSEQQRYGNFSRDGR